MFEVAQQLALTAGSSTKPRACRVIPKGVLPNHPVSNNLAPIQPFRDQFSPGTYQEIPKPRSIALGIQLGNLWS